MPRYHYACEKCEHEFWLNQKITDPPRKRCPECRGKVYRVIKPVGHILKGSGFYRTDYRDDHQTKRDTAAGKDAAEVKKKDSGKKPDKTGSKSE